MATIASFQIPTVNNEANHHYAKGSNDREQLAAALSALQSKAPIEVPLVVGGKEIRNSSVLTQNNPSAHAEPVARYSNAGAGESPMPASLRLSSEPQ